MGRGFSVLAGEAALLDALPDFAPRFPWLTGDLQTLRNSLFRTAPIDSASRDIFHVLLSDRRAGRLRAVLNRPARDAGRQIVLLVHGLGGCEDSVYLRLTAGALLADGHPVVRLNLRGAGPGAEMSRGPYHAGLSADLRDVLTALDAHFPRRPVIAVGFSLGGHMLLRLAGEGGTPATLAGIATVCAPLDLAATQKRVAAPRNRLYERYIVHCMVRDARASACLSAAQAAALSALRHVREFDRVVVAPAHGFAGVEDYYARAQAFPMLDRIALPALILHARDDPWVPVETYRRAVWPAGGPVHVCLTEGGGHVGFHARGLRAPWYVHAFRAWRDFEAHSEELARRGIGPAR